MSVLVSITKCMFCDGFIPASYDDVYIKHMNDHHEAFVNIKFLFQVSLLSDDDDVQCNDPTPFALPYPKFLLGKVFNVLFCRCSLHLFYANMQNACIHKNNKVLIL